MQTPVRLHYVNNIFYVNNLCICLHTAMVVHHIEHGQDPETEDMYDVTSTNENAMELDEEEVKDNAQIGINAEDIFLQQISTH